MATPGFPQKWHEDQSRAHRSDRGETKTARRASLLRVIWPHSILFVAQLFNAKRRKAR